MQVILTVGLPASGKSTWAKERVRKDGNWVIVCKDDLRAMLFDTGKWSGKKESTVVKMQTACIKAALADGKSVIVADTNLNPAHKERIKQIAKSYKADVSEKSFLDVPLETCIERDLKRPVSVGERVIRDMHAKWLAEPVPEIEYDPNLPDCILVDIDGTLAIMGNRSPYDWHKVGIDKVNQAVKTVVNTLAGTYEVIVFSGRDGVCQPETEKWLIDNQIACDELHMRKPGDQRKDAIVKRELYEQHVLGKYNVIAVIDDRLQVVRMWHAMGLPVMRVGDPDASF